MTDEFGMALDPTPGRNNTTESRYDWLGGKQRSSNARAGLMIMGARLYNPGTARFLSTDPVPGGGANTYSYPSDPVNQFDLDGRSWKSKWRKAKDFYKRHETAINIGLLAANFIPGVGVAVGGARFALLAVRGGQIAYRAYRARKLANVLGYTVSAGKHIEYRKVMKNGSRIIRGEIMKTKAIPDPRGGRGAVAWAARGYQNGKAGTYELVVRPSTRQILHYNFR